LAADKTLIDAAKRGDIWQVETSLTLGAAPNAKDDTGATSLHFAAREGHLPVVERLLDGGASLDTKDDGGSTPLHSAAEGGHEAVVELLLKRQESGGTRIVIRPNKVRHYEVECWIADSITGGIE
jgi:ankyrin repeat protein